MRMRSTKSYFYFFVESEYISVTVTFLAVRFTTKPALMTRECVCLPVYRSSSGKTDRLRALKIL